MSKVQFKALFFVFKNLVECIFQLKNLSAELPRHVLLLQDFNSSQRKPDRTGSSQCQLLLWEPLTEEANYASEDNCTWVFL